MAYQSICDLFHNRKSPYSFGSEPTSILLKYVMYLRSTTPPTIFLGTFIPIVQGHYKTLVTLTSTPHHPLLSGLCLYPKNVRGSK